MNTKTPIHFCATGKRGLGHLRRITNIAKPLYACGYTALELYTNAQIAGVSSEERALFDSINVLPKEEFARQLLSSAKGPIVVDTAKINGLAEIDVPLVLILRETKSDKLSDFRLGSNRLWDKVLVPNPHSHWSVDADRVGAHAVENVGWIYRLVGKDDGYSDIQLPYWDESSLKKLRIVISSGGGGHVNSFYANTVTTLVNHLKSALGDDVHILQARGPRANPSVLVPNVDAVVDVGSNLNRLFHEADIVISSAGYNSVLELAATSTPTLLLPVETTYDDQAGRARRWGALLGHTHIDNDQSCEWLVTHCRHYRRRAVCDIGPSGAQRAASCLGELTA